MSIPASHAHITRSHLIAPGCGNSSAPPPSAFTCTFDNIAGVIGELATKLGLSICDQLSHLMHTHKI
ncbi:hypothetical protein ACVIIV_003613 [Bradyrhizobium sp. USDA 4354]